MASIFTFYVRIPGLVSCLISWFLKDSGAVRLLELYPTFYSIPCSLLSMVFHSTTLLNFHLALSIIHLFAVTLSVLFLLHFSWLWLTTKNSVKTSTFDLLPNSQHGKMNLNLGCVTYQLQYIYPLPHFFPFFFDHSVTFHDFLTHPSRSVWSLTHGYLTLGQSCAGRDSMQKLMLWVKI